MPVRSKENTAAADPVSENALQEMHCLAALTMWTNIRQVTDVLL